MKSNETIAAQGRAVAFEVLNSISELDFERVMDLGLPGSVFATLALRTKPLPTSSKPFVCDHSPPVRGLSGLRPQIFLNSELSETEAIAAVGSGIFEMARAIYLGSVPGADAGDLDAWLSAELPLGLRAVGPSFIEAYGDDRSMLRIDSAEAPAALCSFTALRRLVLQDA